MSVNIDYEPPGPTQDQPRRRSRRGLVAAVAVGVVVLVIALLTQGKAKETVNAAERELGASSSAPGVARGAASSTGSTATRLVSGKPRGFPHTEIGAIEAATSYMAAAYDLKRMSKPARAAYVRDVTGQNANTGGMEAAAFRAQYNLNEQGQLVGPVTGAPVPDVKFTSACYPALGAYRVEGATGDQVRVQTWFPCVVGTIPTAGVPNLDVIWTQGIAQMTWKGRDWVATGGSPTQLVRPENRNRIALPLPERAQLLGPGWALYSDASEAMPADLAGLGELR